MASEEESGVGVVHVLAIVIGSILWMLMVVGVLEGIAG